MLLIFSFMAAVMFLCLFIYSLSHEREVKAKKRLKTFVGETQTSDNSGEKTNKQGLKSLIEKFKDKGSDYYSKKLTSQKEEKLDKLLLQMGNPWGITSAELQLYTVVFKIALPIGMAIIGKMLGSDIKGVILLLVLGIILSLFLPNYYFNSKIKNRYAKALKEIPDFIDLLTVSLEAGLGFDLALNKVIAKTNGILSHEFHTCLEEIRLGKTRREALSGVKERLNFDSIVSIINSILQAEKLGMSMVQIFRIKSLEEREKRKQRAEEAAMKAPIKILFPLVLFIFPSIFIVLLGPAILQMVTSFGK